MFEAAVSAAKTLTSKEKTTWVIHDNLEHWDVAAITPAPINTRPDEVTVAYDEYVRVHGQVGQSGVWHFQVDNGLGRFLFIGKFSLALRAARDLTAAVGGRRAVLYTEQKKEAV